MTMTCQMQNDPMPGIYSEAALCQDHAPISNPTGSTSGFWQIHHGHLTNTKYRSHQSYQEHAPESRTLFPSLFRGDNTIDTKIDTLTPSLLTHYIPNRLCCVPYYAIYIILSLCPFHSSSLRNYLLREAYSAHFAYT